MTVTKDEAIQRIAKRLRGSNLSQITMPQFKDVVAGIDGDDKKDLLAALRQENAQAVGAMLTRLCSAWAKDQAVTEATAMLADDALSLDELDKVL
jgi:hypothetical protein